jgi:cytochrome c551/c552
MHRLLFATRLFSLSSPAAAPTSDDFSIDVLSERIRKGSLGKWGRTVAMPGHRYLSDNELTAILSAISLKGKGDKE